MIDSGDAVAFTAERSQTTSHAPARAAAAAAAAVAASYGVNI